MKITDFTLEEFKPLLHNKIHKIRVNNISQITILTGPNGWGKSSILRELTPYPAVRSDYGKNGKKVLHITHDKSNYVLTSDFSKQSAHSFIKDDVELNLSGTTDVQTDLVNTHFSYSKTLDSIMLGTMKITSMGRPARREMFMSTYPGSLEFILNHFTRLSTQSRAIVNQLKLLKERQTKTSDNLISDDNLKVYKDLKSDLDKVIVKFDQNIFLCNNTLETLKSKKDKLAEESEGCDIDMFKKNLKNGHDVLKRMRSTKGYDVLNGDDVKVTAAKASGRIKSLSMERSNLMDKAVSINENLAKYEDYLKTDYNDMVSKYQNILDVQNRIVETCKVDDSMPVMDKDTISHIKPKMNEISDILHELKSFDRHWTKKELADAQILYAKQESEIGRFEKDHTSILNMLGNLKAQRAAILKDNRYPKECKLKCPLKESVDNRVKDIENNMVEYLEAKDDVFNQLKTLKSHQNELKNSLVGRPTAEAKIDVLEGLICRYAWSFYILGNVDLISALNSNSAEIWNRLQRLIGNSENHFKVKEAKELIAATNDKLETLKSAEMPAKVIVTDTLLKNKVELRKMHARLDEIDKDLELLQKRSEGYREQLALMDMAETLNRNFNAWVEFKKVEAEEQLLMDIVDDLNSRKTEAYEKLRSIESIIQEQHGYLTILNNELMPTIAELESKLKVLNAVIAQLSPVSGIPYKYTIQYINELFNLANSYIRRIWEHDLELVYFTDNDEFDFIFKLLINNSSELKDINMCSKGQKSLIDLVVNLAICIYRGYTSTYPLKLDEIDDGMTPSHQARLTEFLGELLQQNTINQVFIMNHHLAVSSSFRDAGVISLSSEDQIPSNCRVISTIN